MLFAINAEQDKIGPFPNGKGICPGCKNEVFAKCGKVNVWHWSHHKDKSCDSFSEPETYWHRNWKEIFGKENTEIVIKKGDKWHFADILTKGGLVIELQNSPLNVQSIKEREVFYGKKMIWVLNSSRYGNHFSIDKVGYLPSPLYKPQISVQRNPDNSIRIISVDFKDHKCDSETDKLMRSIGFVYSPTRKIFYKKGGLSDGNVSEFQFRLSEFTNEVNCNMDIFGREYSFHKDWPARSWKHSERHIFIDYKVGVLLRIVKGMGEKTGIAKFHRTRDFIKKYAKKDP